MVLSLYSGCAIADSSNKKIILISLYFVEFGTKGTAFRQAPSGKIGVGREDRARGVRVIERVFKWRSGNLVELMGNNNKMEPYGESLLLLDAHRDGKVLGAVY